MHTHDLSSWTHTHRFDEGNPAGERGAKLVMWITLAAMVVEIGAGWWFNSMALMADGWHMSSHALAIGLSAFAYSTARRLGADTRFAFGTWKIEMLAAFASAIVLLGVAALMVFASVERLVSPQPIGYRDALLVAVFGLAINLVCAGILAKAGGHGHSHGHAHGHDHDHGHDHAAHGDLNLKSAYVHVLADAATSVLAIGALVGGWIYGWSWLDPAMGVIGAVLVAVWAKGLLMQTAKILLDREMDHPVVDEIREVVEALPGETRVADLHVWRVGTEAFSCAVSLVTHDATLTPDAVRRALSIHEEIVHTTVEINHCA